MRDYKVYLDDIIVAAKNIETYTKGMAFDDFIRNVLVQNTVIRNFEIIGEAIKKLPKDIRNNATEIKWQDFAGFRDVLLHQYFQVNLEIVWKAAKEDVPELKLAAERLKAGL